MQSFKIGPEIAELWNGPKASLARGHPEPKLRHCIAIVSGTLIYLIMLVQRTLNVN